MTMTIAMKSPLRAARRSLPWRVLGLATLLVGCDPPDQAQLDEALRSGEACMQFEAVASKDYTSSEVAANKPWCTTDAQVSTVPEWNSSVTTFQQTTSLKIPAEIPITPGNPDAGNSGNHRALFQVRNYTSCSSYTSVQCVYKGGSSQAYPTSPGELAKATSYSQFLGCFTHPSLPFTLIPWAVPGATLNGNALVVTVQQGGNDCAGQMTEVTVETEACPVSTDGAFPECGQNAN